MTQHQRNHLRRILLDRDPARFLLDESSGDIFLLLRRDYRIIVSLLAIMSILLTVLPNSLFELDNLDWPRIVLAGIPKVDVERSFLNYISPVYGDKYAVNWLVSTAIVAIYLTFRLPLVVFLHRNDIVVPMTPLQRAFGLFVCSVAVFAAVLVFVDIGLVTGDTRASKLVRSPLIINIWVTLTAAWLLDMGTQVAYFLARLVVDSRIDTREND